MCGIAGYLHLGSSPPPRATLERMTTAIAHRGPDDFGFFHDDFVSLGHRRLSIIDVAAGHQPISNETDDLWIVYNGEIFNHAVVREDLERASHVYRTRSDTETIIHAYEEYGDQCPTKFRGMFAFALWDQRQQRLFCVRDRMGIKPFYYFWDGETFVFASEIKALLEHPAVPVRLEESLLAEQLTLGFSNDERTMFANIRKLMPGHTLTLDARARSLTIRRYWEIPAPDHSHHQDEGSWIEECFGRLEETVRMRLMSDVPLGMFLSGGVDSSLIAALMKRMVSGPVKTFAVGYQEGAFSELAYARRVAEHLGTEHHEVVLGMSEFFQLLPKLVWHEDEPITWPSSVSLYAVSRLAAQQVKVVLTGEGSDELFAGYGRYRFLRLNRQLLSAWRLLPAPLRRLSRDQVAHSPLLSASLRRKLGHTFVGRGEDLESLYLDNFYAAFSAAEASSLLGGASHEAPYERFLGYWNKGDQRSDLERMLYTDQKTYLVELLMKQDQMSMATSIESRVPLLDHTFVEFSTRVPDSLKLRGKNGKYLIKKAAERLLPHDILYRPKMGFPTPLRQWLMDPAAQPIFDLLQAKNSFLGQLLDARAVSTLLDQHQQGQHDATDRIWRLLNLELWGSIFLLKRDAGFAEGLLRAAPCGSPAAR